MMAKSNSNKKSDTKSSKLIAEEKPQEQVTDQESTTTKKSPRGKSKRNTLTPRQEDVFKLIVEGNTNKEIADSLKVSVKTVDAHRATIMMRLQIHVMWN
jgi:DNA-binding NarL/FixJ family response regulator